MALASAVLVTWRVGPAPALEVEADAPGIGRRTAVHVVAEEPARGVARTQVALIQGERETVLLEREHPTRPAWAFWGQRTARDEATVQVGRDAVDWLAEGPAVVRVSAWPAGTWLRRPEPSVEELELTVDLTPPLIQVLSSQHYPTLGGSEVVVYQVEEGTVRDGVQAGEWFFPGYDLPGRGGGERFALFAVPFDLEDPSSVRLVAEDGLGNRAERAFVDRLLPKEYRSDRIGVSDSFIETVAPEIESQTTGLEPSGSLLDRFLAINGDLRRENRARIRELTEGSAPEFLWHEAFLPFPNAQVMAGFGDHRTYTYGGEEVDRQDHLGIDLASLQRSPVPAAADGRVLLAGYLGIYGNVVLLDHGYGLATLYAHLSALEVSEGDAVTRGQTLGRTGATGLAGGDHLHYGVFLRGLAVRPEEWWDAGWIRDRLQRKLGDALPLAGGGA
ncbi:MAG: M23 family metallopeptidase [Thermoanaerobaculia bacterium]